mgnify:CR=1 FL=1
MVGKKGPFGGFCNYGIFGIWGKDPETGKKKYKKVDAVSEVAAVEKAAALGCVDPQSVEVIPFLPPSEKQQRYAVDLGVRLPEGCTVVDATALLSRAENGSDQDPAPGLVEYAQSCGVCFSTLAGEGGLLDCMICQLPIREKAILFAHAVAASVASSGLADPRKAPQYLKFCQFADQVAADPALAKSVEATTSRSQTRDRRHTRRRWPAYKK